MFRLPGEPNRLMLMSGRLDGALSVGGLTARVGISQSPVSHHLRLLRAARLLRATRQGKRVLCTIPDCHVRDMLANMIEHMAEPHDAEDPVPEGAIP